MPGERLDWQGPLAPCPHPESQETLAYVHACLMPVGQAPCTN